MGSEASGISLEHRGEFNVGSLRYFATPEARMAVQGVVGTELPSVGCVRRFDDGTAAGSLLLAWRSPSESLLLSADAQAHERLIARVAAVPSAGCLVDQTGGLWVWELTGERCLDLFHRLGSIASVPAPGQARTSRMADLPVMVLCIEPGRYLWVVERVYAQHLMEWIDRTVRDF